MHKVFSLKSLSEASNTSGYWYGY